MANVFLSHSTSDKAFVKKLAMALLGEGCPVWLDSWELELGDSLTDGIYDGIEGSSYVLLAISRRSSESDWVNRELNAALALEERVGRKFLIPLRLDDSPIPLKVADRFYADFTKSFTSATGSLTTFLVDKGCREFAVPKERELVPLDFTKGVHLNSVLLGEAVKFIRARQKTLSVIPLQVKFTTDPEYDTLRTALTKRVDNVATDEFFSPAFETSLRRTLQDVINAERRLSAGVALILNSHSEGVPWYLSDSLYWFCKRVRSGIIATLWSAQNPNDPNKLTYGKEWYQTGLFSNTSAAKFFEVDAVSPTDVFHIASPEYYVHAWVDAAELKRLYVDDMHVGPDRVREICSPGAISKYLVPQMVENLLNGERCSIPWDFADTNIGIH
jgi:hypothetical protein